MKKKLNFYLDCCILEAYTTTQNNKREKFGTTIFCKERLQGCNVFTQIRVVKEYNNIS